MLLSPFSAKKVKNIQTPPRILNLCLVEILPIFFDILLQTNLEMMPTILKCCKQIMKHCKNVEMLLTNLEILGRKNLDFHH